MKNTGKGCAKSFFVGFIVAFIGIFLVLSSGSRKESVDENAPQDRKIEVAIRNSLPKKITDIRVTEQINGGYGAVVIFNGSDNTSDEYIKKGIWLDMADIYSSVFKQSLDVNEVVIIANMKQIDKYGNEMKITALKTRLTKMEAEKVNWRQPQYTLGMDILPNIWSVESSVF